MRWAYQHSHDDKPGTPQQEDFRLMYKNDRAGFLAYLLKQEQMHRRPVKGGAAGGAEEGSAKETPMDEGSQRAHDLCRDLLEQFNTEEEERNGQAKPRPVG